MAYGDYDGPNKPDKGKEGGSCNRTACQSSPANWYNHASHSWYCCDCKRELERVNNMDWDDNFRPSRGYPMFETREMIEERRKIMAGLDNILETLDRRFTSSNSVPVDSARITKEEYEIICDKLEEQSQIISGLEGYLSSWE